MSQIGLVPGDDPMDMGSYPGSLAQQPEGFAPAMEQPVSRLGTGGYMDFQPVKVPIEVRASKMVADARQRKADLKRMKDTVTIPAVQEDFLKSAHHAEELRKVVEQTRLLLENPVPKFQPGRMDAGNAIGAGLAGLFGGAEGFNQAATGAYGRINENAKSAYTDEMNQFNQNQGLKEMDYKFAMGEYDDAQKRTQDLKDKLYDALQNQDEGALRQVVAEIEAQSKVDVANITQEGLTNRASLKNIGASDKAWLTSVVAKNPGARYIEAIQRGYSEADAQVISNLTPAEIQQIAGANLKDVQGADIVATRESRIAKYKSAVDRDAAYSEYVRGKLALLPKFYELALNRLAYESQRNDSEQSRKVFDAALQQFKDKYGPTLDKSNNTLIELQGTIGELESLHAMLNGKLGAIQTPGNPRYIQNNKLRDEEVAKVQGQLSSTKALLNGKQKEHDKLEKSVADIEEGRPDPWGATGTIGGAAGGGTSANALPEVDPTTTLPPAPTQDTPRGKVPTIEITAKTDHAKLASDIMFINQGNKANAQKSLRELQRGTKDKAIRTVIEKAIQSLGKVGGGLDDQIKDFTGGK